MNLDDVDHFPELWSMRDAAYFAHRRSLWWLAGVHLALTAAVLCGVAFMLGVGNRWAYALAGGCFWVAHHVASMSYLMWLATCHTLLADLQTRLNESQPEES